MPHIDLPEGAPGIRGPMEFRPETAVHLNALAEELLRADNSLSRGDRELIAAYVSSRNKTVFCEHSHSAFAAVQLDGGIDLVEEVKRDPDSAAIEPKLRALLHIAGKVAVDGKNVTSSDIEAARAEGATDLRSTTPSSSQQPSACTTAMSTASTPGSPRTRRRIENGPTARRTWLRRFRDCVRLAT